MWKLMGIALAIVIMFSVTIWMSVRALKDRDYKDYPLLELPIVLFVCDILSLFICFSFRAIFPSFVLGGGGFIIGYLRALMISLRKNKGKIFVKGSHEPLIFVIVFCLMRALLLFYCLHFDFVRSIFIDIFGPSLKAAVLGIGAALLVPSLITGYVFGREFGLMRQYHRLQET